MEVYSSSELLLESDDHEWESAEKKRKEYSTHKSGMALVGDL